LLLVTCALGSARLLEYFSLQMSVRILILLTIIIAGLDFYHLDVRYYHIWDQESTWFGHAKSLERYRAYQILDKIRREKGNGLIYSDFTPGLCDQTLTVADHSFNAAQNPDLSFREARWIAVLVNVNYKPFLNSRFSDGQAYGLSAGLSRPDGGQMLWVMPVTSGKAKILSRWQAASDSFCCFPGRYNEILKENLVKAYYSYRGDPFLESCFWEKLADLDFRMSRFQDANKPIEDLENGLKNGYKSSHIYQRLAVFHLMRSEIPQAKEDLRKALKTPLDLTQSQQLLDSLPEKIRHTQNGISR